MSSIVLIVFLCVLTGFESAWSQNLPLMVGVGCSYSAYSFSANSEKPAWSYEIFNTKASHITLHFSMLNLPVSDYIVLKSYNQVTNISKTFVSGKSHWNIFTTSIKTNSLTVELYTTVDRNETNRKGCSCSKKHATAGCYGIEIDFYRAKTTPVDHKGNPLPATHEALCGKDASREAKCFMDNGQTHTAYLASRPVARLLIHKKHVDAPCSGFLLGCEGHLITNYHCVSELMEAENTEVEFLAEGKHCAQNCAKEEGCRGKLVSVSSNLVAKSKDLDYALLKLRTTIDLKQFGFLRLRNSSVAVGEKIYIPQHPLSWGKRISMHTNQGIEASVTNTSSYQCGVNGVTYSADTRGGSSGSPVISSLDHSVVALHHCGGYCGNNGVPAHRILADLDAKKLLPKCATFSGSTDFISPKISEAPITPKSKPVVVKKFSSAIVRNGKSVSVDQYEFTLSEDAEVEIDVLSVEVNDDVELVDVNKDGKISYIDPVIFLFQDGKRQYIGVNDDAGEQGRNDGSVSFRDSYLKKKLRKGITYMLAIGSTPLQAADAYKGTVRTNLRKAKIYENYRQSNVGQYQILFVSQASMQIRKKKNNCHRS